ncbi:MAG: ureidoglycolate lyase [Burkholderiaceae bacterium]|nr:ureidoglycolate lyase [Burkholderiaceae bacterium]
MNGAPTAVRTLALQPLAHEAFAPYGFVVAAGDRAGRPINDGTSQRIDLPDPDVAGDDGHPALAVFRASAARLPFAVRALERHRLGGQTFVPLGGSPFAVVVALGDAEPDPASMRAFLVDGRSGVHFARGVWHHPLLALADGDFVVLERRGAAIDCEVVAVAQTVVVDAPPAFRPGDDP